MATRRAKPRSSSTASSARSVTRAVRGRRDPGDAHQSKSRGGTAYADLVWKPRVLIEMKKRGRDLPKHYRQAFEYWIRPRARPPQYVVLCNFDEFRVYDLNRQLEEPVDTVALEDLPRRWEALAFLLPHQEEPSFGNDLVAVTRETAAMVSGIFNRLVERGIDRDVAQRFILQAVMAMFARTSACFRATPSRAVEDAATKKGTAYDLLFGLFREMNAPGVTAGGRFEGTPYFNGGLYAHVTPFDLTTEEMTALGSRPSARTGRRCGRSSSARSSSSPSTSPSATPTARTSPARRTSRRSSCRPSCGRGASASRRPTRWRSSVASSRTSSTTACSTPPAAPGNFLYVAYRELRRLEHQLHRLWPRPRRG